MMRKTIVVCDDHAALLSILKHILAARGYEVLTAGNGEDALALVRTVTPGILILDLAMPVLDGIGVLKRLGAAGGHKPYVIILSGQDSLEKRDEALSLGAQEVWKKPFNAAEFMSRIDGIMADAAR